MKKCILLLAFVMVVFSGCNPTAFGNSGTSAPSSQTESSKADDSSVNSESSESTALEDSESEISADSSESQVSSEESSDTSSTESSEQSPDLDEIDPASLSELIGKDFNEAITSLGYSPEDFEKSKKGKCSYISVFSLKLMGYSDFKLHFNLDENDNTIRSCWLIYKSQEPTEDDLNMVLPLYESFVMKYGEPCDGKGDSEHFSELSDPAEIEDNIMDFWSLDDTDDMWMSLSVWNGEGKGEKHNVFSIAVFVEPKPKYLK